MLHSTASRKLQVCCTAAAVGIGAYRLFLPSLDCGFTFDDHLGVVNNADVDTSRCVTDSSIIFNTSISVLSALSLDALFKTKMFYEISTFEAEIQQDVICNRLHV